MPGTIIKTTYQSNPMPNYSEIILEITEQETELISLRDAAQASIELKTQEIQELQERITSFVSQLEGLQNLKTSTQALIDSVESKEVNINLNIQSNGSSVFNGSTQT